MIESPAFPKPLTGRFVLVVVVLFFAVVVGVNAIMMMLALKTLPGVDVDSAYRASLAYAGEIKAAHEQAERNWRVDAHVERQPDGLAILGIRVRDGQGGSPPAGVEFSGRLERPADKRGDRPLVLTDAGGGLYRGTAADVASGQWDLVLEGERAGKRVFLSKNRIVLN